MQTVSVLVVEDDALVGLDLEGALQQGGYAVTMAANADEAITSLEAPNEFRALLTDINLGGEKTGWDVARRARELFAELPVIYITSVPSAEWASQGVPKSILVAKPFAVAQVITAISQLLNSGDRPGPGTDPHP